MYVLFPIAYPIAWVLDFFLGEQHGTMYRKSGTNLIFFFLKKLFDFFFFDTNDII
jgi:hypothetical protein